MPIDVILAIISITFVIGSSMTIYYNRITSLASVFYLVMLVNLLWLGLAYLNNDPKVGVTLHEITPTSPEQYGNQVVVHDSWGRPYKVEIEDYLKGRSPLSKKGYKVIRKLYSKESYGIQLNSWSKFELLKSTEPVDIYQD